MDAGVRLPGSFGEGLVFILRLCSFWIILKKVKKTPKPWSCPWLLSLPHILYFQNFWNLATSHHLSSSTLAPSLLGYFPTFWTAFLLLPLASCALLSTQQPEWLCWNVSQIRSPLCKFLHLLPVSHRMKAKVLTVPSKLHSIWLAVLFPAHLCLHSYFSPSPGFLVVLWMDTSSFPPEGLCCTVPSTWILSP